MSFVLQSSTGSHRNGTTGGNGNAGTVSPRNQTDVANRKRLSDSTIPVDPKKRHVQESEQQINQV